MKIGALVPVGPLHKMSYQYNYKLVIENLCTHLDEVILLSTSRETTKETLEEFNFKNLDIKSDESVWFPLDEKQNEVFDFVKASTNYKEVVPLFIEKEVDILVIIDINMYIRDDQIQPFRDYCQSILDTNQVFGWRYRSLQVLDKFSVPNIRHPWVHNLRHMDSSKLSLKPDESFVDGKKYRAERGHFESAPFYFTDIYPSVLTYSDYVEKYHYYLKYLNIYYNNPKNYGTNWYNYIRLQFNKFDGMTINTDLADKWGQQVINSIKDLELYHYFQKLSGNRWSQFLFSVEEFLKSKVQKSDFD